MLGSAALGVPIVSFNHTWIRTSTQKKSKEMNEAEENKKDKLCMHKEDI